MDRLEPAAVRQRPKSFAAPDMCHRGDIIKERWEVTEKLGAGTFGQVYKVLDLNTGLFWALKVESKKARKPHLRMDVAISKAMHGKKHAAAFFACGHESHFSYMVTQLLGRNLASIKRSSQDGRFPLRTCIRVGIQTLNGLRDLHECGYLHRDVKPSNLATGVGIHEPVVYIIDFGLARKYLDDKGHIYPPRPKANFRGTVRYASPRVHLKWEQSRGDDLWSLLYSLIDLHIGHLPWHNIREMKRVGEAKMSTPAEELCRGFPSTWRLFHSYCRALQHNWIPDYEHLIKLLNGVTDTRRNGIIDVKSVMTAEWEWDASAAVSPADTSATTD